MRARRRQTLPESPSRAFLAALPPDLVAVMEQQGLALQPRIRPVRMPGGAVGVRLVWRVRATGLSVVVTVPRLPPHAVQSA